MDEKRLLTKQETFKLPIPYSLFPIPYSLFPIPYSLLPTPYSLNSFRSQFSDNRHGCGGSDAVGSSFQQGGYIGQSADAA